MGQGVVVATETWVEEGVGQTLDYRQNMFDALEHRRHTLDAALSFLSTCADDLALAARCLVEALRSGGKVLAAGNGGSAAEAQHFVAELVGRFKRERDPYAALALTADTAVLTALANDYGYDDVFARQVYGLGRPGDVLLLFSTSGESENVVRAAAAARAREMQVVAVVGGRPCRLDKEAHIVVKASLGLAGPCEAALAQEVHMVVTHLLCDIVESEVGRLPARGVKPWS